MKRWMIVCALCSSLGLMAQGLRQSVCVVYPQYNAADSTMLAAYADAYHRAGLTSRAETLNSYAEGTFGSGVVIEKDGQLYVLTNRHVAGYADEVRIVFQIRNTPITYDHCPVYSSYADADLAVIRLPETAAVACQPIALEEQAAVEGETITAVGFPGLGGKASWQMSRGTVSNSALSIEDDDISYIQHTAPIDPGSSGGALLRKTGDNYGLLGVNTLKAFYRDRVGIAIGCNDIRAFLATLATPDTTDRQVLDALQGYDAGRWHEYYGQLPAARRDSLKKQKYVLPLDFALAVYGSYDVLPAKDEKVKEAKLDNDRFGINRGVGKPFTLSVSYDYFFNGNSNVGLVFGIYGDYVYQDVRLVVPMYIPSGDSTALVTGVMAGYSVGGQLPLRINRTNYLVPHVVAGLQAGLAAMTKHRNFGVIIAPQLRAGIDYRLDLQKIAINIGAEYVFQPTICSISLPMPSVGGMGTYLQHGLNVHLGVGF